MTAIGRIISLAALVALAASLLYVVGCGAVHRLNGTYVGMRPYQVQPGQDDTAIRQLATVSLTVKPDGTADLSDGGIPVEGHIDYGTETAKFVPDAIAGMNVIRQPQSLVDTYTVPLKRQNDDQLVYKDLVLTKKRGT